jgi:tetratricopeptide (TPR) repeat protein
MTLPDSPYPSLGNQLLRAGTRGVVAMAYSVYVSSARRFMARLYESLINGEYLGPAVKLGREELRAHPQRSSAVGDIKLDDWVVPVLFEAAPVRVMERREGLKLDLGDLKDQQAKAEKEVGCPEPPVYGFVGRDGVMLDLERAFQDETVVLLRGMAGVGKSEMAVGFARWRAETGALDGPIFFFKFENYLPLAQVCDRVGQVFNPIIREQLGQEWHLLRAEERRRLALLILKRVPCLLIWDNFEPVAGFPKGSPSAWTGQEQAELRGFLCDLRGGKTKVLITSRREEEWLGNIYRLVELGGLRLSEAQELALRVLRRAGLKESQIRSLPQYNQLLEYMKGNPLAIQVVLPELRRREPETLLVELRSGEANLGEDDPQLGREKSLHASLTYRLDELDTKLRGRLGILALFQGFVDADVLAWMSKGEGAPEQIAGMEREAWLKDLQAAAEVGLLQRVGEGYYSIHPALPWFFHDLLEQVYQGQQDWLEGAFCGVYGGYAYYLEDLFKKNAQLAMTLLGAEEDNLVAALRLAWARAAWGDVGNLLYGLKRMMDVQGRWVEWERLVEALESESADKAGQPLPGREALWVSLLGHRAEIAMQQRDFDTAEAVYLRLKAYLEEQQDENNQAGTLHQLGIIADERRQFDKAERWYRQSLAIRERIGDEYGQASTLHQLGRVAEEQRQFDEAERWYRQSLAIEERIRDEYGQAQTLHQLGRVAEERRQFDEAERLYRQSLAIEERIRDEYGQAQTLHQLGMVAEERRQFDEAERWYRQSLAIEERIRNEYGQAQTLHQLGIIAEERRQFDEAERWYRQSLAIKERIRDGYGQASTLHQLGMVAQEQGDIEQARSLYKRAEAIFIRLNDPYSLEIVRKSLQRLADK